MNSKLLTNGRIVLIVLVLVSLPAWGKDDYSALHLGSMSIGENTSTTATFIGIRWGMGISPSFAIELDGISTISGGHAQFEGQESDYRVYSGGAYLAYRLRFTPRVYAKARFGAVRNQVRLDIDGRDTDPSTGTGGSGSLGVGMRTASVTTELDLTRLEKDINTIGIAASFSF